MDPREKVRELEAIAKRDWKSMSVDARKRFMRDMNRAIEDTNRRVRASKDAEGQAAIDAAVDNAARKLFT